MKKLFIAIPVYHEIPVPFLFSLLDLLVGKLSVPYEIKFTTGESLISRARNRLAADFLESNCSHLLFIDSDILFTLSDIDKLVKRDLDIVGGLYTAKRPDVVLWCANTFEGQDVKPEDDGLVRLKFLATGFLMIARNVFEKMIEVDGETIGYRSDLTCNKNRQEYDFFRVGVKRDQDRYLSEDWWFCQRANDMGFKIWADSDVILRHLGKAEYPLIRMDAPLITNEPLPIAERPLITDLTPPPAVAQNKAA